MEVEGGIIIRDVQTDIGRQMQQPSCCHNAVMQLNMGEGKAGVITPMVTVDLADGSRLLRVIVGNVEDCPTATDPVKVKSSGWSQQ